MAQSKTQIMNKALMQTIAPFLHEKGFTGEYPNYIRELDNRIDAVSFVLNRASNLSIEIAQVLPDGSVPGQSQLMDIIKASWVHYSLKHRLGSVPWGHEGFLATGWLDTQRMAPDRFPSLSQEAIELIQQEAEPWFAAEPVLQYLDLVQFAIPKLAELGFSGAFPDFQRRLPERIDMLGFFLDKRGQFAIEIAQVRPDGSEGIGKPPYGHCKPDQMRFYNVSPRLRRRLKGSLLKVFFHKGSSPTETALAMINGEAEPWFRNCPALR